MKKVLVCGVGNSRNLGDRIIAETINYLIHLSDEPIQVTNFDFTVGKVQNSEKNTKIKLNSTSLLKKLTPNFFRRIKVLNHYKNNNSLKIELEECIANTDLIVIGGGHLLIDNYLNFPKGINNIVKVAKSNNIPVVFSFVGAKGPWNKLAKMYLLEALDYARCISVRDSDSKDFLVSISKDLKSKVVVLSDPALFVKEMCDYKQKVQAKKKIGLGIMDPHELKRHSNFKWSRDESAFWWSTLTKKLISLGFDVNIFTNGSPTDNGFVEFFIKKELGENKNVFYSDYPSDYSDLISIIQQQDIVIAQRLHACLPSISLGKNTFGVIWDRKLSSIFRELRLEDNLIDFTKDTENIIKQIITNLDENNNLVNRVNEVINIKKKEMLKFAREELWEEN